MRMERLSVIDQVALALRQGILGGEWQEWLPGERRLCADLRVGRNTLRSALRGLEKDGLLQVVPGQGARILGQTVRPKPRRESSIGLLTPGPLELLFPRQVLWIDGLRGQLAERGCLLKVLHGQHTLRSNPETALQRLVEQESCGCWILVFSSRAAQRWFEEKKIPCLIAGSCHEGVNLPYVDIDYRALCRHAVTTLLRLGHQRVAYMTTAPEAAGDLYSEEGFWEGLKSFSGKRAAEGRIIHHGSRVQSIAHATRRLLRGPTAPTAILLNNSSNYLTVFSTLSQMGLKVPDDVSLVCRDSETFLSSLYPAPACYFQDPHQFATKVTRIAEKLLQHGAVETGSVKLMPEFIRGASTKKPSTPSDS